MDQQFQKRKNFERTDLAILIIAFLGFLITFYALFFDATLFGLLGNHHSANGIEIGKIIFSENSTRKKSQGSFSWDYAEAGTLITLGDSLFTGKSKQTQVSLQDENTLDLGMNTLIHFVEVDGIKLPNFAEGNVNISVKGKLKIAIQGQMTEIEGKNAKVQLFANEGGPPQLRLIEGEAVIQNAKTGAKKLNRGEIAKVDLFPELTRNIASEIIKPQDFPVVPPSEPTPEIVPPQYYKLYDFYNLVNDQLQFKQPLEAQFDFLPLQGPQISSQQSELFVGEDDSLWRGKLSSSDGLTNFVVETSTDQDFKFESTRINWHPKSELIIKFDQPRRLYLRARAVNQNSELTPYSEIFTIHAKARPAVLAQVKPKNVQKTVVAAPAKPFIPQAPIQKTVPKRKIAAVEKTPQVDNQSLSTKIEKEIVIPNKGYNSSIISFETSAYNMYSGFQAASQVDLAQPLLMGLHLRHWFDQTGLEGFYRSKASTLNEPGGFVSPTIFDLRYHLRFKWGFNPLSRLKESQVSLFLGYEMLRNNGTTLYRDKYDILKAGFQLYFPLFQNWDTGGTVVFGRGLDSTLKYEITGNINYFFRPRWSWGAGYRIHLYQSTKAGEVAGQPYPANYREGTGEGYTVLRWHY